jgi:hypothetical protein
MEKQTEINMLSDIHTQLIKLPQTFRKAICRECSFSVPTFYRKARAIDKKDELGNVIPALSNAERSMIITVVFDIFGTLLEHFNEYRKGNR